MEKDHHQRLSGIQRMNPAKNEVRQTLKASTEEETLTKHLMEKVCEPLNLNQGF